MEKEPSQSTIITGIRETHIKDMLVVELWSRLQVKDGQTNHTLIVEMLSKAPKQIIVSPEGKITEIHGEITKRRSDIGHPVSELVFIPNDGSKEIILKQHEF